MTQTSVVTGGAGFIGSNLVHALLDAGHRVRVMDDLSTGRLLNLDDVSDGIELVHGDVRDQEAVARAVDGAQLVFHEAAIASVARSVDDPISSNEVNVAGTLNVLVAARDANVERLVYASSAAVYGNADALPLHEGMPTRPESPYGVSKLAGERYLEAFTRTWGLPTVALRNLNVFGPRQNPRTTRRRSPGSSRARSPVRRPPCSEMVSRLATSSSWTTSCERTCSRPRRPRRRGAAPSISAEANAER